MTPRGPLRILHVIETAGPGGAETVLLRLATAQYDAGHHVECIVKDGDWLRAELRAISIPSWPYESHGAFDRELVQSLRHRIRSCRADIVHAHLFGGAVYAGIAARLEGVPCVATLHGHTDVRDTGAKLAVKAWLVRHSIDTVVAVSDSLRAHLAPRLKLTRDQFHVIPNGVPSVPEVNAGVRLRKHGQAHLIAIGNIRRPKNYPGLVDAVALLRNRFPAVHLKIAGQPDRDGICDALLEQMGRLGLAANVELLGFVADPTALLAEADCFVLASTEEGFSLATIEAMLAGVPIVATRSGGPEEILADGQTGLLVPVEDPAAIAAAVTKILESEQLARDLAAHARADALARFTLTSMVTAYQRLYHEALARRPRSGDATGKDVLEPPE